MLGLLIGVAVTASPVYTDAQIKSMISTAEAHLREGKHIVDELNKREGLSCYIADDEYWVSRKTSLWVDKRYRVTCSKSFNELDFRAN